MLKKILIGFGALVLLLLAAIIIIPFVVDVDQYRPQIVALANEQINGKLAIGKMKLSLWGRVEIKIDGITVTDSRGDSLVKVGEAYALLPFTSIIAGKPQLTLRMTKPEINVIKGKDGKLNVLSLVKASSAAAPEATQPAAEPAGKPLKKEDIPYVAVIFAAGIDVELRDAFFSYVDRVTDFTQVARGFNFLLTDISLSRPMNLKIWSDIETKVGKDLHVKGPLRIEGKITPHLKELAFDSVDVAMIMSFDDLKLDVPGTFTKQPGQPANIKLAVSASTTRVDLKKFDVKFLEATASASATVSNLGAPPEKLEFKLAAQNPGVDLDVALNLSSFAVPQVDVVVQSKGIDFDVLFPPPPGGRVKEAPKAKDGKTGVPPAGGAKDGEPAAIAEEPATDVDAALEPLRKSPFFRGMGATIKTRIASFKGFQTEVKNIVVDCSFKNLVAGLDQMALEVFAGKLTSSASVDLKPAMPQYRFQAKAEGFKADDAVASQFESFRNTIMGVLSFDVKGSGQSLNADKILPNLDVTGNFAFTDAAFQTVDIGVMVKDGLNGAIGKVAKKVPQLGGKSIAGLPEESTRYEYVGSNFMLKNGVFDAPNFQVRSAKGKGIDLEGATKADLVKDRLEARWFIIDRYNVTRLADIGIEEKGIAVPALFRKGDEPIKFPVEVGCKLSAPCYKYEALPEYLYKVAYTNMERALKGMLNKRLDEEKAKLKARLDEEKKKLEAEKAKKLAELEKKKDEAKKKASDKARKEADKHLKGKANEKGKEQLKKLGL